MNKETQTNLENFIASHKRNLEKASSFIDYLYCLMDKYNVVNPSEIYNKVFISRQLWSSIISGKSNPSLNTCIKIALGLNLDNHECKLLLKKAGYTLASSSKAALIIRFAIENQIYDINEVYELLKNNGCEDFNLI